MQNSIVKRLRRLTGSVFVKCTAVTAASSLIVALIMALTSLNVTNKVVKIAVLESAEITMLKGSVSLAAPVRFRDEDKVIAALAQIKELSGDAGLHAFVLDTDGAVLTSSGDIDVTLRAGALQLARDALVATSPARSVDGFTFAEPIVRDGTTDIVGVFGMVFSDASALDAAATQKQMVYIYGLVTFLVLTGLSFLMLRFMLGRPLLLLNDAIERVSEGDYATAVAMADRPDEFGGISRRLQILVQTLDEARIAEVERQSNLQAQSDVVKHLSAGLVALADGALTHVIAEEFPEEYETLRANFNATVSTLRQAMLDVQASAQSIRGGAEEIGRASEDLSHRTETQAATLEQTAAALDQLVASVKSAADGAREVDETVKTTNSMTERNAAVMKNAVAAMAEIENSSDQIGEIIGVIDDIAFQTNLLALNAGVEAARAGTAGKGFAVVASEVRALAQRSSDAARQIKSLVGDSSVQVKSGAQLVENAGAALMEVVDRVEHISGLVSGIAQGAVEQSQGIQEINLGVTNLDQVTQQNAAMVEQSTAAAHLLLSDSTKLSQMVSKFQVELNVKSSGGKPGAGIAVAERKVA